MPAAQLNDVLPRLYAHYSIGQKAYTAILVKTDWPRPEIVLTYFSRQGILEGRAIIHGEGIISYNSDFRSGIFVPQDFSSRCARNTVADNQIGLPRRHCIAPLMQNMILPWPGFTCAFAKSS